MEQWEKELATIRAVMNDMANGMAQSRAEHEKWKAEHDKSMAELRERQKENAELIKEVAERQKEVAERQKETDEQMRKTDEKLDRLAKMVGEEQKKTDEQMRKTDEKLDRLAKMVGEEQKKTDEQMRKTDEKLDRLAKNVGGINDNIGFHAEQYFQNIFDEKLSFGGQKYDYMRPNLKYGRKGVSAEFDIVLVNGESVAVIEAKNRIHPKFVEELATDKVLQFRRYYPEYKNYKLYLGVAGFSFDGSVIEEAKKYGIGVVRQVGELLEINDNDLKVY